LGYLAYMNGPPIFSTRAIVLRQRLIRESNALTATVSTGDAYRPFAESLLGNFAKMTQEVDSLLLNPLRPDGTLRSEWLSALQSKAANLFGEALTLKLARCIRNGIDSGMCSVADRLLAELAAVTLKLPHLSTVADTEFTGVSARIVRLRYPATSIWDLPVLGHEFGHSFGPLWYVPDAVDHYPQQVFLENRTLGSPTLNDEYFCDLLATFMLGPCYVSMCIIDRFDPTFNQDSPTHPADLKRAWWVLRGLELLADSLTEPDNKVEYRAIASSLRDLWRKHLADSGLRDLSEDVATVLELAVQSLFSKLHLGLPNAAYTRLSNAWGLLADYKEQQPPPHAPVSVADLVNAAWLERVNHLGDGQREHNIAVWIGELLRSSAP
jgi:hypothetical protein